MDRYHIRHLLEVSDIRNSFQSSKASHICPVSDIFFLNELVSFIFVLLAFSELLADRQNVLCFLNVNERKVKLDNEKFTKYNGKMQNKGFDQRISKNII